MLGNSGGIVRPADGPHPGSAVGTARLRAFRVSRLALLRLRLAALEVLPQRCGQALLLRFLALPGAPAHGKWLRLFPPYGKDRRVVSWRRWTRPKFADINAAVAQW